MAASVDSPSPTHLTKDLMVSSSPVFSPASDKRFWSSLHSRINALLEKRHRTVSAGQDQLNLDQSLTIHEGNVGESSRAKRMKEDTQLLLRGFDSVAFTLSQLSNNLDNALQGARKLAEPPTLSDILHSNLRNSENKQEGIDKKENEVEGEGEEKKKGTKRKFDSSVTNQENDLRKEKELCPEDKKLRRAKNIAISMATKASSLALELKSIKSDLCFVQERCTLLEEENRRLRDGFSKGIRPEEDELMRLQMEALLAEKSRLANENANLVRENQCLHQLVEYHQFASQDLSASYEEVLQGMCLDFSSPTPSITDNAKHHDEAAQMHQTNIFSFSTSLDKRFHEEQD